MSGARPAAAFGEALRRCLAGVRTGLATFGAAAFVAALVMATAPATATATTATATAPGDAAVVSALRAGGHVLMIRHASTVPGVGDPPHFDVADCSTQRNLSDAGRVEATRFGAAMRAEGIAFARVLSSRWCRCLDTARLAFGAVQAWTPLDSFFAERSTAAAQTDEVRRAVAQWSGPGNLALVTHHVNIEALTGEVLAQGEAIVLQPRPGGLRVVGRLRR